MGRKPCCEKVGLRKGAWTAEEDKKLIDFMLTHVQCCWRVVPKLAGLLRCGKSCRLRWTNYLRPDLRRGLLSEAEEKLVIDLHSQLGNRWSKIASHLPGRTDNEIKNLWNTHIKKKLKRMGIDPLTHRPLSGSTAVPPSPDPRRKETEEEEQERDDSALITGGSCPEFCTDEVPIMEPHEMLIASGSSPSSSSSSSSSSSPAPPSLYSFPGSSSSGTTKAGEIGITPWVEVPESVCNLWGPEDLLPLWDSIDEVELWKLL